MDLQRDLLNIRDTARTLNVSERTIFTYIKQGTLKSVKVGGSEKKAGKIYIPKVEIERILSIKK